MCIKFKKLFSAFLYFTAFFISAPASAQLEYIMNGYSDEYLNYNEGPGATREQLYDLNESDYIYESPTLAALSYTYWNVGFYSPDNDNAIDEFIKINECPIYQKYREDEFEWKDIRQATREFLIANRNDFPTRYSFIIPLRFGDYDYKLKAFHLDKSSSIKSKRRFQITTSDFSRKVCTTSHVVNRGGYPRVMTLEFSRPFTLTTIAISEQRAEAMLQEIREKAAKNRKIKPENLRYFYLVMNLKIFTHGGLEQERNKDGFPVIRLMSILESYQIFEDSELKRPLYGEKFIANIQKKNNKEDRQEEFKELDQKANEGSLLLDP